MNALDIEKAWRGAASEIYAPLAGLCGTSSEIVEGEDVIVVFTVRECRNRGGGHWIALIQIDVDAPALSDEALIPYSDIWTALLAWLEDVEREGLVAAKFPSNGINLKGYFLGTSGQGMQGDRWVASIQVTAGHTRV